MNFHFRKWPCWASACSFKSPLRFHFEVIMDFRLTFSWRQLKPCSFGSTKEKVSESQGFHCQLSHFSAHIFFFSLLSSKIKMSEIISFFLDIIVTFKFSITVNFLKVVSLPFSEQLKKFHQGKKCAWSLNASKLSRDFIDINLSSLVFISVFSIPVLIS